MGSSLPIMVTKRSGKIECKRVVKWSAVFQLVFQPKIKKDINVLNQYLTDRIQITPAHQIRSKTKPAKCGFCCIWGLVISVGSITIPDKSRPACEKARKTTTKKYLQPLEQPTHSGRST
jgi:hypothetical protein